MLKAGAKRRRNQQQIKDQKEEEEVRQQGIEYKLAAFERLQQKMSAMEQDYDQHKNASLIIAQMVQRGQAQVTDTGSLTLQNGQEFSIHGDQVT